MNMNISETNKAQNKNGDVPIIELVDVKWCLLLELDLACSIRTRLLQ